MCFSRQNANGPERGSIWCGKASRKCTRAGWTVSCTEWESHWDGLPSHIQLRRYRVSNNHRVGCEIIQWKCHEGIEKATSVWSPGRVSVNENGLDIASNSTGGRRPSKIPMAFGWSDPANGRMTFRIGENKNFDDFWLEFHVSLNLCVRKFVASKMLVFGWRLVAWFWFESENLEKSIPLNSTGKRSIRDLIYRFFS